MAQSKTNKLYRTFTRGLITEASYLTYPEDSSLDELNTVPTRKGNRFRRPGIDYLLNNATGRSYDSAFAKAEFVWRAVASDPTTTFLVVQNANEISFYDRTKSGFAANKKSFVIDLNAYVRSGVSSITTQWTRFSAGKGYLFIANVDVEPLVVTYDLKADTIKVDKVTILARDFEGLKDGLANDAEPSDLSKEHRYNLLNQGWSHSSNPIDKYKSVIGVYPSNSKQWWTARADADDKDAGVKAGDFQPKLLQTFYSGNNKAPRGHFILDQFRKDRSAVSGVADIPVEEIAERPNSVTFFSGRAWFSCQSTVYYSQILDSKDASKAGLCYQEADPTAEDISDLIPNDGGVVPIPEADHIEALYPLGNGVLVFAQNGVWFVSGGDQAFTATNISVSKVSPIGTRCPNTIVETAGMIFWWSEIGIQALQQSSGQFNSVSGQFGNTNIAEQTIQTFYNNIGPNAKHLAKGVLDHRNNTIYWLYSSDDLTTYEYDSVLVYDITLQAFYPWRFTEGTNGPRLNGLFLDSGYLESNVATPITDGGVVVSNSGTAVTDASSLSAIKPSAVLYLAQVPGQGLTTASPSSLTFTDWPTFDGVGQLYDSFILTGYELNGDAMRKKQIVYLFAHFRNTEDVNQEPQSSCKMVARWDWAGERNTNKWSSEVEAYRPRTINLTDVVVSKHKVRGSGKSVQFRFGTNEPGKTFDLLGWSVGYSGVTES